MKTVAELMALVDELIAAAKKLQRAADEGSDAEYEAADIAVDRARADVNDALINAAPQGAPQGAQEWQPIETAPKVGRTEGRPWDESERVVVQVSHHGEVYAAFGKYTHSRASGYEWNIEGHGGDWSNRVIGWMPLPAAPQGAPK